MIDVGDMGDSPEERDALNALARSLRDAGPGRLDDPPADLRARTLAAIRAADDPEVPAAPRRGLLDRLRPRPLLAGVALAAAAVVVALAIALSPSPDGDLEADATLGSGAVSAHVEVREIGIGRTVQIDSDSLASLPKGEYYEVWFVGPGDSRSKPNRISAGTFHPDAEGRSHVTLKAAADPSTYRRMELTREPGDGDPRPSAKVSLSGRLALAQ